jgi:hypothetical protein
VSPSLSLHSSFAEHFRNAMHLLQKQTVGGLIPTGRSTYFNMEPGAQKQTVRETVAGSVSENLQISAR